MADGFYTNDEDYPGSFGGYGSDGAESDAGADVVGGGCAGRPVADQRVGVAGGYGVEAAPHRRIFRRFSRGGFGGGYGRAA